jgi:hypothetical protein
MSVKRDLPTDEIWAHLIAAGARVYVVLHADKTSTGNRAVLLTSEDVLVSYKTKNFGVMLADDVDMIPLDEYDDATAVRRASHVEGFVGVVADPGSPLHSFQWFRHARAAERWSYDEQAAIQEANPDAGEIPRRVLTADEAWEVVDEEGRKAYFRRNLHGRGYRPDTEL